jgi:outer membrane protein assembly factor BamB
MSCADRIVVGDYTVMAYDAGTGNLVWRFTPPAGYGAGYYVGDVSGSSIIAGSPAGRLYSIDCASGALEWSATIAPTSRTSVYEPVVDGSIAVAGYTSFNRRPAGGLVAVDRATGQVRWRVPFPSPSDLTLSTGAVGRPVVAGSLVIASSANGIVHALDRTTGARRWTIAALEKGVESAAADPDRDFRSLAVAGPLLIVGSLTGRLTAYDITTQAVRWSYRAPERGGIGFRLRVAGSHVYVPYVDGVLHCVDAASGQREWAFGSWRDGFIWPPAVDGDSLYVAGLQAGFQRLRVAR